jgi:hypothetical protein
VPGIEFSRVEVELLSGETSVRRSERISDELED